MWYIEAPIAATTPAQPRVTWWRQLTCIRCRQNARQIDASCAFHKRATVYPPPRHVVRVTSTNRHCIYAQPPPHLLRIYNIYVSIYAIYAIRRRAVSRPDAAASASLWRHCRARCNDDASNAIWWCIAYSTCRAQCPIAYIACARKSTKQAGRACWYRVSEMQWVMCVLLRCNSKRWLWIRHCIYAIYEYMCARCLVGFRNGLICNWVGISNAHAAFALIAFWFVYSSFSVCETGAKQSFLIKVNFLRIS